MDAQAQDRPVVAYPASVDDVSTILPLDTESFQYFVLSAESWNLTAVTGLTEGLGIDTVVLAPLTVCQLFPIDPTTVPDAPHA